MGTDDSSLRALRDLHAVEAWQHQVEDDEIGAGLAGELEPSYSVRSVGDLVAVPLQVEPHQVRRVRVVLYNQDSASHSDRRPRS